MGHPVNPMHKSLSDPSSSGPDPASEPPDPYAVWRHANYCRYALGWFLLAFSKMIETVAIGVHVYAKTEDPLALGWIGLVQALPMFLFAIPGGQLADRFDRRRVMMATLTLSTAVSLGLTLAAWKDVSVAWIYLLLFIGATSAALGTPSRSALLPQIVPKAIFPNAITWNSSVFHVASMTGPAAGGMIVGHFSVPTALATVVVCRVLSLFAISLVRTQAIERLTEAISLENLVAGFRFVWSSKLILATITLDLFAVLLGGATYLLPVYSEDILRVGPQGLGLLRSAEAVGAVTMAVLLAHLPPMQRAGRNLLWAVAGFGAATAVFGLSTSFGFSLAAMFLIGALDNVSVVVRHTLVQMLTPDAMRGRVSAVNSVFIVASNDLGGLESGVTARLFGPVASVVLGGLGAIGVALAAAKVWPQILTIGSLQSIRPAQLAEAAVDGGQSAENGGQWAVGSGQ